MKPLLNQQQILLSSLLKVVDQWVAYVANSVMKLKSCICILRLMQSANSARSNCTLHFAYAIEDAIWKQYATNYTQMQNATFENCTLHFECTQKQKFCFHKFAFLFEIAFATFLLCQIPTFLRLLQNETSSFFFTLRTSIRFDALITE